MKLMSSVKRHQRVLLLNYPSQPRFQMLSVSFNIGIGSISCVTVLKKSWAMNMPMVAVAIFMIVSNISKVCLQLYVLLVVKKL